MSAYAVEATWRTFPTNSIWNSDVNWTTNAPVNPGDTATFNTSLMTNPTLTNNVTIESITFSSNASAFTIRTGTNTLTLQGTGIVNNSTNVQTIINGPAPTPSPINSTRFGGNATAGTNVSIINEAGADTQFLGMDSTAGRAMIDNRGDESFTSFTTTASGGDATISNNGASSYTVFSAGSHAQNARITNRGDKLVHGFHPGSFG